MELLTSIIEIAGSYYIRIPPAFVEYYELKHDKNIHVTIQSNSKNKISFSLDK